MQSSYFDIGANLTHESFENDIEDVLNNANIAGIKKICITSTSIEDTKRSLEIVKKREDLLITTCGIHPHYADSFDQSSILKLKDFSKNESVKAIGETGLDFNRNFSKKNNQIECFISQLELAKELRLPLFLHQRDSHKEFLNCIEKVTPDVNAVVHCFTEDKKEFYQYLDKGFWIGFTGWICDPIRGKHMQDLLSEMPLDRIMIETDSPYLLPKNLKVKGRRNEPKFIVEVAKKISELQKKDLNVVTKILFSNSLKFFNLQQ